MTFLFDLCSSRLNSKSDYNRSKHHSSNLQWDHTLQFCPIKPNPIMFIVFHSSFIDPSNNQFINLISQLKSNENSRPIITINFTDTTRRFSFTKIIISRRLGQTKVKNKIEQEEINMNTKIKQWEKLEFDYRTWANKLNFDFKANLWSKELSWCYKNRIYRRWTVTNKINGSIGMKLIHKANN